ncbi:MAG: hopanoid C-3 methylase HpnR [Desulfobacteraceae bacterium]|nr:hopanoid C-3 methylase HpnR [Desulfobacteraceae bacterium]
MKVLFVNPGPLPHSEIFLRLEPLGLECVAEEARREGHEVRLLDLQVYGRGDYERLLAQFRPEAVGLSLNYIANVPEVLGLIALAKERLPATFLFVGGHIASFIPAELLAHAGGALDCVVRGEGESAIGPLLAALPGPVTGVPGVVTGAGSGPPARLVEDLDRLAPARDLTSRRRRYFMGQLDPCASVEFSRGCPYDCAFCSAWVFYGRRYRRISPAVAAESLARIREPSIFVVDDIAFADPAHGMAIADEVEKRGIRKRFYVETRVDNLLRSPELFARWCRLGLRCMFLGVEALTEEDLKSFRKRTSPEKNFEALAVARKLGISVALNLIVDPEWDEGRFRAVRTWAEGVPDIVHLSVKTPYPGTEIWNTDGQRLTTRDYRLFDIQHAVLPTRLPLDRFYRELVTTQAVLSTKHLGFSALRKAALAAGGLLLRGQTNFVRMLWKFNTVYNAERRYQDHFQDIQYFLAPPPPPGGERAGNLYVHG